jgi:hypothetical protein
MPADDRLWFHEDESRLSSVPVPLQQDPEDPIASANLRPFDAPLEDRKRLAQGEIFECETVAIAEESTYGREQDVEDSHGQIPGLEFWAS